MEISILMKVGVMMQREHVLPSLKITLIYLLLGCAWIAVSDRLLLLWIDDIDTMRLAQTYKGWFYVGATALLMFFLVYRSLHKQNRERDQYLRALKKSLAKAEESERLKTAFLNNLCHEVRTPMNSILGFSRLLEENPSGDNTESYVRHIHQNGNQLMELITDIIIMSSLESGNEDLHQEAFDIATLTEIVKDELETLAKKEEADLHFYCNVKKDQVIVLADKEKLLHILRHLLKNAIEYAGHGKIECSCQLSGNEIQLRVADNGPGITPEHQGTIFERFRQVLPTEKKILRGLGLGLPIVKAYTELMGGEISLVSEPGKGSVFCIDIPCELVKP